MGKQSESLCHNTDFIILLVLWKWNSLYNISVYSTFVHLIQENAVYEIRGLPVTFKYPLHRNS